MNAPFFEALKGIIPDGRSVVLNGAGELDAYGHDRTALRPGPPMAVLFPASTEQVADIVRMAREFHQPIVPSGGRTGYAGGASAGPNEVVVSLERMDSVLHFDPALPALTVQAGMTTAAVQEEARRHGLYFPVDFASAGTAQIGGNLATHAGGIRVLHYGTIRRYATGLTAVAGSGEVLRFPGSILKNNTGYDLKELLIGSEGTLAIITEATLRLVSPPPAMRVALLALTDLDAVVACLEGLRAGGLDLYAFEAFDLASLDVSCGHAQDARFPFSHRPPWSVLMEFAEADEARAWQILEACPVTEILPAESPTAERSFWKLREGISEALSQQGRPLHKNDVSLPPQSFPRFIEHMRESMLRICPGADLFCFGHVADGNLHINILAPHNLAEPDFRSRMRGFDEDSYALIQSLGGSISAEHGIGALKKESLHFSRSPAELRIMAEIKRAFDPDGILNPGKVLP